MFFKSSLIALIAVGIYILTSYDLLNKKYENLNFQLLSRNVVTLPEDNVNYGIKASEFGWFKGPVEYDFKHGVASGDPLEDAVILWTRISLLNKNMNSTDLIKVGFRIGKDENLTDIVDNGLVYTNNLIDYTIKIDLEGLVPNQTYFYQFYNPDTLVSSAVGRTRTLPVENQTDEVKLAVYSCANYAGGLYHAYKFPAVEDSVDYIIHLGDYIYELPNGVYTNGTDIGRDHHPKAGCYNLDDYRARYASYRLDKDLQLSHSKFPWILVWDDHEVADNSWLRGSVETQGYDFLKRRDQATQAYFEWLPIRPQLDINKIWRSFKFGELFKINMLDTRHYSRDITDYYSNQEFIKNLVSYEDRTILGYDQEKWLERRLVEDDTAWSFIASQCVVRDIDFSLPKTGGIGFPFEEFNQDAWDGYVANRNRLLNFIKENNLSNTVLLSGDFHIGITSELSLEGSEYDLQSGNGSIIVEFTTSAVSSPTTFPKWFHELDAFEMSHELVHENNLLWNDGYWRGYLQLTINVDNIKADYFGVAVRKSESDLHHLASFQVNSGESHIDRSRILAPRGALNSQLNNIAKQNQSEWSLDRPQPKDFAAGGIY